MKIAIMTQPLGKNYGGIMQAWALQQVLKRMGHEPVTIDRQPKSPNTFYRAVRFAYRAYRKSVGMRQTPIVFEMYLPYILKNTKGFIDENLIMSEPLYSARQLREHFSREGYQAVIVGSDQVWRPKYSPSIYDFFLGFLNGSKEVRVSYASSFGVDHWEFSKQQERRVRKLIARFDAISVREASGVNLCQKYLGAPAELALDPTLLLSSADYVRLIGAERLSASPGGVYTYFLDNASEAQKLVRSCLRPLGEEMSFCQPRCNLGEQSSDVSAYVMPGVKDWLAGFANSKLVVTDSFHGMIFSIIFNKPVIVVGNRMRGLSRFFSLRETLKYPFPIVDQLCRQGLERALIDNLNLAPSYRFSDQVAESYEFLRRALRGEPGAALSSVLINRQRY